MIGFSLGIQNGLCGWKLCLFVDGQLRKTRMAIKVRGGNHGKDIRQLEITLKGLTIRGKCLIDSQRMISGVKNHSNRVDVTEEPVLVTRVSRTSTCQISRICSLPTSMDDTF